MHDVEPTIAAHRPRSVKGDEQYELVHSGFSVYGLFGDITWIEEIH